MAFGATMLIIVSYVSMGSALSMNRYDVSCPNVEAIVAKVVRDATSRDKTVPATLLRMHFHDCFIRVSVHLNVSSVTFYTRFPSHFLNLCQVHVLLSGGVLYYY